MGKLKQQAVEVEEYFVDEDPSYLTMARFMHEGWDVWSKEHIHRDDIVHTIIRAKDAYQDGFMAGFYARFFKQID